MSIATTSSRSGRGWLLASALLSFATPHAAAAQPFDPPEKIIERTRGGRTIEIEELLIAAGRMNSETGSVTSEEYARAIQQLRPMPPPDTSVDDPLSATEIAQLHRLASGPVAEAGFQKRVVRAAADMELQVWLPLAILGEEGKVIADSGGTRVEWHSNDGSLAERSEVSVTYHPPGRYTLPARLRTWLTDTIRKHDCRITLFHIYTTADMFRAEGTYRSSPGGAIADCDVPLATSAEQMTRATDGTVVHRFHVRGHARDGATIELAAVYPERAHARWEALVNLMVSRFQRENVWQEVNLSRCDSTVKRPDGVRKVIVGTNRKWDANPPDPGKSIDIGKAFGSHADAAFGSQADNALHLGVVAVPRGFRTGGWFPYLKNWSSAFASSRGVATYCHIATAEGLAGALRLQAEDNFRRATSKTLKKSLLYVHGYANSLATAVARAADVADGADPDRTVYDRVFVFSWPSRQRVLDYTRDIDLAEQSEPYLEGFLRLILKDHDLDQLDVLVHSLGAQPFIRAARAVMDIFDGDHKPRDRVIHGAEKSFRRGFGQIIFAAPDVSTSVFREKIGPLIGVSERITVYASSKDRPLQFSRWMLRREMRVGGIDNSTGAPFHMDKIDTIDVSDCAHSRLGLNHDYFAHNKEVLEDIRELLRNGTGPGARQAKAKLIEAGSDMKRFWRMRCADL